MRLWHKGLIQVLPHKQLVSQLREIVLISKEISLGKKKIFCLVDPIFNYNILHFHSYLDIVFQELDRRGYKYRLETLDKLYKYIHYNPLSDKLNYDDIFKEWHNDTYLFICFINLLEKYKCGGISENEWQRLETFYLNNGTYVMQNKCA